MSTPDVTRDGAVRPADPLPLRTARVALRRLTPDDLPGFQAYRHDAVVGRYQGWLPTPDDAARAFLGQMHAAAFLRPGEWFQLGIAARESNALIGDIGVCVAGDARQAEIGFTLGRPYQGQGLAAEAVRAALGLVFAWSAVRRIVAVTDERNAGAIKLLQALGLARLESHAAMFRGEPCIEHVFALARPHGA